MPRHKAGRTTTEASTVFPQHRFVGVLVVEAFRALLAVAHSQKTAE